jgi:hypothetical protein
MAVLVEREARDDTDERGLASARCPQTTVTVFRTEGTVILTEKSAFEASADFFRLTTMDVRVVPGERADVARVRARFREVVTIAVLVVLLRFSIPVFPPVVIVVGQVSRKDRSHSNYRAKRVIWRIG